MIGDIFCTWQEALQGYTVDIDAVRIGNRLSAQYGLDQVYLPSPCLTFSVQSVDGVVQCIPRQPATNAGIAVFHQTLPLDRQLFHLFIPSQRLAATFCVRSISRFT